MIAQPFYHPLTLDGHLTRYARRTVQRFQASMASIAKWFVRSLRIGVIETKPSSIASKSVPPSAL
jgi:hypothetical protein